MLVTWRFWRDEFQNSLMLKLSIGGGSDLSEADNLGRTSAGGLLSRCVELCRNACAGETAVTMTSSYVLKALTMAKESGKSVVVEVLLL